MGDSPNIFVTNGTCYWAPGQEAADTFSPCGNEFYGPLTCCELGDWCLSSNACYDPDTGVTYLAACTDSDYDDGTCPDKGDFDDLPWGGLVNCAEEDTEPTETVDWVLCDQSRAPTTLAEPDDCSCPTTSRTVAFTDAAVLAVIASLPQSRGESMQWEPGFYPTYPPDPSPSTSDPPRSTSSPTDDPSPSSSSSSTPTSSSSSSSSSSGISSSAKIGIAVGSVVGGLILLSTLLFLIWSHRRRQRKNQAAELPTTESKPPTPSPSDTAPPAGSHLSVPATPALSELQSEGNAARPWSLRSELGGPDTPLSRADRDEMAAREVAREAEKNLDAANALQAQREAEVGREKGALPPVAELPG